MFYRLYQNLPSFFLCRRGIVYNIIPCISFCFLYDIYNKFGHLLDDFQGTLVEFQGIRDLLEEHLSISFLYPLTINKDMKIKLSPSEREVRKKAFEFLENTGLPYFYSKDLLPEGVCTPSDFETIHQLIKKRVFIPNIIDSN